jgi:gliding motility-associated-like protein
VAASAGNCSSDSRTQVNVVVSAIPTAPASVTASSNQSCVGSTVILTVNNPDANLNYRWYTVATGGTALFEGNSYTTQALTATTTYYVESVSKSAGCPSSSRTSITITVTPILATPVVTVQTVTNSSILFAWNAVAGATGYEISINGGTNWNPVATTTYLAAGLQPAQSVTILVRAKGQVACQTSANSTPTTGTTDGPTNADLYVPNTFTPNGDGRNDIFLAYGNSVANFKMRIYNQWGQMVSETSNISQGWDGTFKGTMQPSGVYVYQIEATFSGDATVKMYKGTVTLLR